MPVGPYDQLRSKSTDSQVDLGDRTRQRADLAPIDEMSARHHNPSGGLRPELYMMANQKAQDQGDSLAPHNPGLEEQVRGMVPEVPPELRMREDVEVGPAPPKGGLINPAHTLGAGLAGMLLGGVSTPLHRWAIRGKKWQFNPQRQLAHSAIGGLSLGAVDILRQLATRLMQGGDEGQSMSPVQTQAIANRSVGVR